MKYLNLIPKSDDAAPSPTKDGGLVTEEQSSPEKRVSAAVEHVAPVKRRTLELRNSIKQQV